MSYFNRITLVGRAVREPEYKTLESGLQVAKFTLAVNRGLPKDSEKDEADFIDIVAWEKLAENVQQYVTKGKLLLVDGRLQIRTYEDKEGIKRKAAEVIANTVRFLEKKDANGKVPPAPFPGDEDAPPWAKKSEAPKDENPFGEEAPF
ncbi:MAG: single-stranded DNA-binding protein [Firmicutes bacterium]|nr:single-stranded DNA-binding protein [Bacillota bacterium]